MLRHDSRYLNPVFDALIERLFTTVPKPERVAVVGQAVAHIAENLNVMGLFFNTDPILISKRLVNAEVGSSPRSTVTWNVHVWDVKGI